MSLSFDSSSNEIGRIVQVNTQKYPLLASIGVLLKGVGVIGRMFGRVFGRAPRVQRVGVVVSLQRAGQAGGEVSDLVR